MSTGGRRSRLIALRLRFGGRHEREGKGVARVCGGAVPAAAPTLGHISALKRQRRSPSGHKLNCFIVIS